MQNPFIAIFGKMYIQNILKNYDCFLDNPATILEYVRGQRVHLSSWRALWQMGKKAAFVEIKLDGLESSSIHNLVQKRTIYQLYTRHHACITILI